MGLSPRQTPGASIGDVRISSTNGRVWNPKLSSEMLGRCALQGDVLLPDEVRVRWNLPQCLAATACRQNTTFLRGENSGMRPRSIPHGSRSREFRLRRDFTEE
jgi:hypothetical protein